MDTTVPVGSVDPGVNRRTHDRYPTRLPVRFTSEMLDFDGTAELWQGAVENISRGGLFVRSEFLEVPGTPVLLILSVPGTGETLRINGHVTWIADEPPSGPGMGVRIAGRLLDTQTIQRLVEGR